MIKFRRILVGSIFLLGNTLFAQEYDFKPRPINYEKFGLTITDNYMWLEDFDSEETQNWITTQEERKWSMLKKGSRSRFQHVLEFKNLNALSKEDDYTFKLESFLSKPPILKIKEKGNNSFSVLINFDELRHSKTDIPHVISYEKAPNLPYLVIAVNHFGRDWLELIVYDLEKKEIKGSLKGLINPWLKFKKDGFFYTRFDEPENEVTSIRANKRLCFHKFGEDQKEDIVAFQNADASSRRTFRIVNAVNDKIIISYPFKFKGEWKRTLSTLDISEDLYISKPFLIYSDDFPIDFEVIRIDEEKIYFKTNLNSSNYKLLMCDTDSLNRCETFVSELKEVIVEAEYLGNESFGLTLFNPESGLYSGVVIDSNGQKKAIRPPKGVYLEFSSFNERFAGVRMHTDYLQPKPFSLNLNNFELSELFWRPITTRKTYKVEIVSYENSEGRKVPIRLVYPENLKKDGTNPLFIRVYGGYGNVERPSFSWENHFILESGGILAFPMVRGGGNLGTRGAIEGRGLNKQNTISDLINASEFLIEDGYTSPSVLFLEGVSHGAFVVTSASIQRPDLYKGVFAFSGPLDLTRISDFSSGHHSININEYGDSSDSISFRNLYRLSPIHQLKEGINYPSFFLFAGVNDTRVPSSYSFRFLSELNDKSANKFNVIHITSGGHGVFESHKEYLEVMGLKFDFIKRITEKKLKHWLR